MERMATQKRSSAAVPIVREVTGGGKYYGLDDKEGMVVDVLAEDIVDLRWFG